MLCFKQACAAKKRTLLTGRRHKVLAPILVSEPCPVRMEAARLCHRAAFPGSAPLSVLSRTAEKPMTPRYVLTSCVGTKRFFPLG